MAQKNLQVTLDTLDATCRHLIQLGCHDQALKVLHAFLDIKQTNDRAVMTCLDAALVQDDIAGVDHLVSRLQELFPRNVRTWELVSYGLLRLRRFEQALGALDRADALAPASQNRLLHRAEILEKMMRAEDALATLEKVSPTDETGRTNALVIRCRSLQQLGREQEAVAPLQAHLEKANDSLTNAGCWKMLGKILDNQQDHAGAFLAWKNGNEMCKRLYPVDIQENVVRKRIRNFQSLFSRDWVRTWTPGLPADNPPVFLVGFPRSGTTLLEQILDAHPDIVSLEERSSVDKALIGAESLLSGDMEALARLESGDLDKIRDEYYRELHRHIRPPAGKVFVDKMPMNLCLIGFIERIFPGARFIVALRHPADCVLSAWSQAFNINTSMINMLDLDWAASLYSSMMTLLWRYESALDIENRIFHIRYEDLVTDFDGQTKALLEFLNVPWDDAITRFREHARRKGSIATPSYQAVTRELYTGAIDRWKNYRQQLAPVMHWFEEAAQRYGYDISGTSD